MTFWYEYVGFTEAATKVRALGGDLEKGAVAAVEETVDWGVRAVAALAPVDTDAYRPSIGGWVRKGGSAVEGRIGTDAPYGRRLEFDFKGPDVLGRTFNHVSLPQPHFGPVADQVRARLIANLRSAV